MMFGELAKRSEDYQTGHNTGTVRALSYMQSRFRELEQEHPHRRYTTREICQIADAIRADWEHHCETFGMGTDDVH